MTIEWKVPLKIVID